MNIILIIFVFAVRCSGLDSVEKALLSQQRLRVTEAQLLVRIEFGYTGPWAVSVMTPACTVLHATLRTFLSWKPSRVEIIFRDINSRCKLESGGVVDVLGVPSSEIAHVVLRMGVGDALPSRGGSLYNALVLLNDDVQMRSRKTFDWDSLPLLLSNPEDSGVVLKLSKTLLILREPAEIRPDA